MTNLFKMLKTVGFSSLEVTCCVLLLPSFFALVSTTALGSNFSENTSFQVIWEAWKTKYGKRYNSLMEEWSRIGVWEESYRRVMYHQEMSMRRLHTYEMGMNEFSDWTDSEIHKLTGSRPNINTRKEKYADLPLPAREFSGDPPAYVNWVSQGYVTEVQSQGFCRSGCFFSATGVLEGQLRKRTGNLTKLSEQFLLDCSMRGGCDRSCSPNLALSYSSFFGVYSDRQYPYEAKAGQCRKSGKRSIATCSGFIALLPNDEASLKIAVASVGPISVHIHANRNFLMYKSGVFYDPTCHAARGTNHAVLIVGYGTSQIGDKYMDYWLVKNSWGINWGENGYIRMARNQNNNCYIASFPSYATILGVNT